MNSALVSSDESWLRLSFAALPTARAREVLRDFDGPQALLDAALDAPDELATRYKLSRRAIEKLQIAARRDVSEQLAAMQTHAISVAGEDAFPPLLREIGDDTPAWLFARGSFTPADAHSIAIVGTRNVTEYGRGLAHRFGMEFARAGWTVVSGLARGIDTAAHRGALGGGGRTIAVTACGLDLVYPSDNRDLMLEIEQNGAVVSEWAPTTPPASWHFPARNRIITGLSRAVVVVEAQAKSGALITATFASEWNREVFAVPGNVHKPQSHGPHQLIKEGANLAESPEDVLQWLQSRFDAPAPGSANRQTAEKDEAEPALTASRRVNKSNPAKLISPSVPPLRGPRPDFSPDENKMWLALDVEPRHLDDIAEDAQLEIRAANSAIVLLELKGAVKKLPGNLFVKVV